MRSNNNYFYATELAIFLMKSILDFEYNFLVILKFSMKSFFKNAAY